MQIKSEKLVKGKRQVTLLLDADETLFAVKEGGYYQLGYPVEDVIPAHILAESKQVTWCSFEQKWITV